MKKNLLTLAVAGAVSATAHAQMYVNPENTGEVLVYPFYTADNGNQTYIHVVNTTEHAKAVKVRILEAENSYEVRDFNLYLSEYDHFAFTIELDESGAGRLVTGDTSCTVPAIPEGGIEFTNMLFEDEKNGSLERTLNGYVEIIEMGQFLEGKTLPTVSQTTQPGWYWTHTKGVPNNCDGVVAMWAQTGPWYSQVFGGSSTLDKTGTGDLGRLSSWKGGGLYGMGIIVNPEDGAAIGYDAVAIDSFVDMSSSNTDASALHYYPGNEDPSLAGNDATSTSATIFDRGTAVTFNANVGNPTLDAVSALFMVDQVMNDYVLEPSFGGETDWVITFPTKRLYVEARGGTALTKAKEPFLNQWDENQSCDPYRVKVFDREEQTPVADLVQPPFSPYTPGESSDPYICYEANVMTFAKAGETAESPLFGTEPSASAARLQTVVETPYNNGWAYVNFNWDNLLGKPYKPRIGGALVEVENGHRLTMANGTLEGLPAVGFSVIAFGNDTLSGGSVLANYAAAHEHKTSRTTSGGSTSQSSS